MGFLHQLGITTGDALLVGVTAVLIFLPSVVPALGNALGRAVDRLRGGDVGDALGVARRRPCLAHEAGRDRHRPRACAGA